MQIDQRPLNVQKSKFRRNTTKDKECRQELHEEMYSYSNEFDSYTKEMNIVSLGCTTISLILTEIFVLKQ